MEIIGLIGIIVGFLSVLITLINNIKTCKVKVLNEVISKLEIFMIEAENTAHLNGEEKRNYVIEKIKALAIEYKVKIDLNAILEKIEELINFSKNVNK